MSHEDDCSTDTLQYASFASPPDNPPIAIPGVSLLAISSQQIFRISRSSPPWMMQKRFWVSGFLCATIHRSSQRIERSIASRMRAVSGEVVAITSSSCMIMSEPMVFWREMECSGVSSLWRLDYGVLYEVHSRDIEVMGKWVCRTYIGDPSCGLRKRTPSSVTLASFRRLTIWNLHINIQTLVEVPKSHVNREHRISHPPLSVRRFPFQPCRA